MYLCNMKKKLIADAGSTKVDWALLSEDGHLENVMASEGMAPDVPPHRYANE